MKAEANLRTPEQKATGWIMTVRLLALGLTAAILGGLNFTSVFPSGETISVVTPSLLKAPWVILVIIAIISAVKFFALSFLEDVVDDDEVASSAPLLLIYNVSVLLQVAKLILWVGLLGYGIWGVVTDSVNWRLLIIPVAIYLVFEVLYAVWMLKICADDFSSSSC